MMSDDNNNNKHAVEEESHHNNEENEEENVLTLQTTGVATPTNSNNFTSKLLWTPRVFLGAFTPSATPSKLQQTNSSQQSGGHKSTVTFSVDEEKEEEEEEEEEAIRKKEIQRKIKSAKKLESFFLQSSGPPKPKLERTKKLKQRDLKIDLTKSDWLDRCTERHLLSCKTPYFPAFHIAWIGFFFCFMGWFAIGPIIPLLLRSGFTRNDIEISNALALSSTIIIRFIVGPFCEEYGPKLIMTSFLFFGGLLVCFTSLVTNGVGLMIARFFIGLIGGSFVPCQFWCTMMFSSNIVGFMSGTAAGFGNSGAGFIVFIMGGLISLFHSYGISDDLTWRYSLLIPGLLMIAFSFPTFLIPSDCPQGSWKNRKYGTPADRVGRMSWLRRTTQASMLKVLRIEQEINRSKSIFFRFFHHVHLRFVTEERLVPFYDWRAWMVGIQYSIASGVELSILTGLTSYYQFEFGCNGDVSLQLQEKFRYINHGTNFSQNSTCLELNNSNAAYVAAIFGLTNIYGRTLGGWLSDGIAGTGKVGRSIFHGIRGRHLAIFISLLMQGVLMMIWSTFVSWQTSAGFLILFSTSVHVSKGAVIALVPFVSPGCVGPVVGVVSAVGNLGGVFMSLMYSGYNTSREVYYYQGIICIVGSLTAFLVRIHDLESGKDVWLLTNCFKTKENNNDEDNDIENFSHSIIKRIRRASLPIDTKTNANATATTTNETRKNDEIPTSTNTDQVESIVIV